MKKLYDNTNSKDIGERVARLEVGMINLCDAVVELKRNDLFHMNKKIDKLDEKLDVLDKSVGLNAYKIGTIIAVLTTIGQFIVNRFVK